MTTRRTAVVGSGDICFAASVSTNDEMAEVTSWAINREPMRNSSNAQDRGPTDKRQRQRRYVDDTALFTRLDPVNGLRLRRTHWLLGVRRTHNTRASPHTRAMPGRLVCNHIRTHASSRTCIVSTGAPLHSGTAEWSRVCAALHAGGSCMEPLSHSLQSFGVRPEARGSPKAPRPTDAAPLAMGQED